jgi:hypothetical protein
MQTEPLFSKAIDDSRPYGSDRFDVFAPKLKRSLTLYGQMAINAWIILESDASVVSYCERPIVIPDTKPKRVVDFWVRRKNKDEFLFLLRPSEIEKGLNDASSIPAFKAWCKNKKIEIKFKDPLEFESQKILLTNWGWIIRDLSSFGDHLPAGLCEEIFDVSKSKTSIEKLEHRFIDIDPVLVRIAIYSLLHRGRLFCRALNRELLNPSSEIELM